MATRQTFNSPAQDDSQYDPAGAFDLSMFDSPATPMSGGSQGFAPSTPILPNNALNLEDTSTGQTFDPSQNPNPSGGSQLPPNIQTFGATQYAQDPNTTPDPTVQQPSANGSGFTPAATNHSPLPSGVPDPRSPGFDTTGYVLGSHVNPDGTITIPHPDGSTVVFNPKTYTSTVVPAAAPPPPATTPPPSSGLGTAVSGGLQSLIGANGATPEQQSLLAHINDIINSGGKLPEDDAIVQAQLESARENESGAFTAQTNDARDELAARGLVGEPGAPQGLEGEAISQISRNLAAPYSQAVRDINTNASTQREARLTSAISAATGVTSASASQLLSALGQGTQRQLGLAQIALDSLGQDQQWNEFLANYGLSRDQLLYQIQQGNSSALGALIQQFMQFAGLSGQGHI